MEKTFGDRDTLFTLQNVARPLGFWIGLHKQYDPLLGGGPFFVMRRKTYPEERCPSLLKYATAEKVEEFLNSMPPIASD